MSDIDFSSSYDFSLDPFVENTDVDNSKMEKLENKENTISLDNVKDINKTGGKEYKKGFKGGNGCKIFLIVILYLIIVETKMQKLLDTGLKKGIFIILFWTIGYDLVNSLIGFEKNVCSYIF